MHWSQSYVSGNNSFAAPATTCQLDKDGRHQINLLELA